jgi:oxygen-independent coproporphyrinogen-3 oxidase
LYWQGEKYLGIGPSAHSYNGSSRQWNVANNLKYINSIKNGKVAYELELLTEVQKLNEYIMISLRTRSGLDLWKIENNWGSETRDLISSKLKRFEKKFVLTGSKVQLTNEGMLVADGIASELFT